MSNKHTGNCSRGGKFLTLNREALRLTKEEFAEAVGVHRNTIGFWEAGQRAPGHESMEAIARVLETSPDRIYFAWRKIPADLEFEIANTPSSWPKIREMLRRGKSNE